MRCFNNPIIKIILLLFPGQCCGGFGFGVSYPNRCTSSSFIDTSLCGSYNDNDNNEEEEEDIPIQLLSAAGDLEKLKAEENRLASMLASVRKQKLDVLRGEFYISYSSNNIYVCAYYPLAFIIKLN